MFFKSKNRIKADSIGGNVFQGNNISLNIYESPKTIELDYVRLAEVLKKEVETTQQVPSAESFEGYSGNSSTIRLQFGAEGEKPLYQSIVAKITRPSQELLHIESIGDDHGLRISFDYVTIDSRITCKYSFHVNSFSDLLMSADMMDQAVKSGSVVFTTDQNEIAIGPFDACSFFEMSEREVTDRLDFARKLVLIESYYGVKLNIEDEFDKDDIEWIHILAESIHGRYSEYSWTNASFTGVVKPAGDYKSISTVIQETYNDTRFEYTDKYDAFQIGSTMLGEIEVKNVLESVKINNVEEICKRCENSLVADLPVELQLVPSRNNHARRIVLHS